MRWSCLNVPLGLVDPAQNIKQIAPAVAAGLIAGGVSLVNGIGNLWSQADTNRVNRHISEDTNEMNYRINQEQIVAARDQYNRERLENRFLVDQAYQRELENRAYNSPAALKQRYLAAGINPYLAMGGSSGGSASGSIGSSVGSPAKGIQPNMIPASVGVPNQPLNFDAFGMGISNTAAVYYQQKESEREDRRLEEQISKDQNEMELQYMQYLSNKDLSDTQVSFIKHQMSDMEKRFALDQNKYQLSLDWNNFQKMIQWYQAEQKDREIAINERLASSNIALNGASINQLNQLVSESQQRVFEMSQNGASQRSIEKYVERQQMAAAEIIERDNERQKRQDVPGIRQGYTDFMNWLFNPVKGIIGASASYSSGYSVSHKE